MNTIINWIYYYLPYSNKYSSTEKSLEIFQQIPYDILLEIINDFTYSQLGILSRTSKYFSLSIIAKQTLKIPTVIFNSFKHPFHKRTDRQFYQYRHEWYGLNFINDYKADRIGVIMEHMFTRSDFQTNIEIIRCDKSFTQSPDKLPNIIIKETWSETYHGHGYFSSGIKYCVVKELEPKNKIIIDKFVKYINEIVLPKQYELQQGYFPTKKYRNFVKYPLIVTGITPYAIKIKTNLQYQ